ncbi:MAG: PilT/PilU family type 4a pilus ATPase [Mariprofundus sp.]|nr:PilT/PilU family type 4a pilus ATPase [Mariprofundus sp.]
MDHALIDELLRIACRNGASDIIIRSHDRIRMRIHGDIITVPAAKVSEPSRQQTIAMIQHLIRSLPAQPDIEEVQNLDFHYALEEMAYFRIHVMRTNNDFGIIARLIPQDIPNFGTLNLPPIFEDMSNYRNGIIFMAGSTGSGKSTSMAAMLNYIIRHRPVHAVTIENPIEFCYDNSFLGTVSQREIGTDVASYSQGLTDVLRETPDIIIAGEVRSCDEIQLALQAAETGHLVMATVHATTAIGSMQRIMTAFPHGEQDSIRERLSENLRAIVVQKLLPLKKGRGRIVALEIMIKNSVVRHCILKQENWQDIERAMEEGHALYGSQSFDQHLRQLVEDDLVSYEDALSNAVHHEDFALYFGHN